MLSKCANPACSARFRYLRQGRIFNLEVTILSSDGDGNVRPKIEHFWLCDRCAAVMKVVWENGAVSTRPLYSTVGSRAGRRVVGVPDGI
jgi:hypothetical protein